MVEVFDLDPADRVRLMEEICLVSETVRSLSACAKLNVAALGNMVSQPHVHIIGRNPGDAAWPGVVFGAGARVPLDEDEREARLRGLRARLGVA